MINTGALPGTARWRGSLRAAAVAVFGAAMLALLGLPASAADGRAAPRQESTVGFDLLVGGFAVVAMLGFAAAVLWYVARNRHSD